MELDRTLTERQRMIREMVINYLLLSSNGLYFEDVWDFGAISGIITDFSIRVADRLLKFDKFPMIKFINDKNVSEEVIESEDTLIVNVRGVY